MSPLLLALLRGAAVGLGALITVVTVMDAGFWIGAAILAATFAATSIVSLFHSRKSADATEKPKG